MKINIFADTICGWCFIGHTNLNNAIKKFPDTKFEISHTPFQLNPEMPAEGISRDKYLQIKYLQHLSSSSLLIPYIKDIIFGDLNKCQFVLNLPINEAFFCEN